jgi:hypothetical protein
MSLKPWYQVVTPREDLRQGKPLDASEFAVHLDQVRDKRAPEDYQDPARFFERTYLTKNLAELAAGVLRRLSGIKVETSAVYNMTTQFGGGKTHALAMLYHLARGGPEAAAWKGVSHILSQAGVTKVPGAATAVFVGTEFDSLTGRGGSDGTPLRQTPWGEIAFQLGGAAGFAAVEQHEKQRAAPSSEVIRSFLPKDRPALILMDELMNYVSRNRKSGLGAQLYSFMQNLSEEARAQENVVLAVSIPASELEMTSEDQSDYERLKKVLDRLGKAVIMSAEQETSEIIRRRLFEWSGLPDDAKKTASAYAEWITDHKTQIPSWFAADSAREAFLASYPFHPTVLSVFDRKWRALQRFQQTRGILRLLALWVSRAYHDGFQGAHKDPLITLGTAPLEDSFFRPAVLEQLGESRLEGAITTDIAGKKDAHALRLDAEAIDSIKKARLHRKVATTIFFESNGGQARAEATLPEIRLAVAEPGLDIGNVETAVEALASTCYYLAAEKNRFRFSLSPNLNKLLADRRASVKPEKIDERVRAEVQKVFAVGGGGVERVYFPEKSGQIPDRPALTIVVLPPEMNAQEKATRAFVETATREHGSSARTFKSALIWAVPETAATLREEARKLLAWEDIKGEEDALRLDDAQKRQLAEQIKGAQRDFKESVWRAYKNLWLLDKKNELKNTDLGLVHSSSAESMIALILGRLKGDGDLEDGVSPAFISRNWSPAFVEWSTKAIRDAFFASPQFPRLLRADAVKDAIARGVQDGTLAYVGKRPDGSYSPFHWQSALTAADVEITDDMYVVKKETAEAYAAGGTKPAPVPVPAGAGAGPLFGGTTTVTAAPPKPQTKTASAPATPQPATIPGLLWEGDVPYRKWNSFYQKFLAKLVDDSLRLTIRVEAKPQGGIGPHKMEEAKAGLRDLGLDAEIKEL